MHVMGYWREDKENWERRYAAVADRIDAAMGEAMMAGKDFESVRDAVDDAMEREGSSAHTSEDHTFRHGPHS